MGRPPGSKNKSGPKVTEHAAKEPLTDEQRAQLTSQWAEAYEDGLAKKKASDAEFKNICKKAKSEGVMLQDIKDLLDSETEEGRAKLELRMEQLLRISRWQGLQLGHQATLFEEGHADPLA